MTVKRLKLFEVILAMGFLLAGLSWSYFMQTSLVYWASLYFGISAFGICSAAFTEYFRQRRIYRGGSRFSRGAAWHSDQLGVALALISGIAMLCVIAWRGVGGPRDAFDWSQVLIFWVSLDAGMALGGLFAMHRLAASVPLGIRTQ